jgi:hypothetical protein
MVWGLLQDGGGVAQGPPSVSMEPFYQQAGTNHLERDIGEEFTHEQQRRDGQQKPAAKDLEVDPFCG